MTDDISFTREHHLGIITLQRVQSLNALTLPMIQALQHQLMEWEQDDHLHAVVIQSAPGRAFCAGGDVRWLYERGKQKDPLLLQFFWHEYRLNHFIHHMKKPYIALMDGVTMGGGVGISLHGSHSVASERFVFAMPETSIGFFPDIGASYLLSRCPHAFGIYLGLTGNRLGPADSKALDLINYVIPSEQFAQVISKLVATDLTIDPHECVSRCLQEFASSTTAAIMQISDEVETCFQKETIELIMAALAEGTTSLHQETRTNLEQKSPLSLKVTLAQLQRAKKMSFSECIKLDYCLVKHFMEDHDFYEGVRALLIDKDKSPRWQPSSLAAVTSDTVANYFECDSPELLLIE